MTDARQGVKDERKGKRGREERGPPGLRGGGDPRGSAAHCWNKHLSRKGEGKGINVHNSKGESKNNTQSAISITRTRGRARGHCPVPTQARVYLECTVSAARPPRHPRRPHRTQTLPLTASFLDNIDIRETSRLNWKTRQMLVFQRSETGHRARARAGGNRTESDKDMYSTKNTLLAL